MSVYFTSDLHLGHKNICKYRTKFTTVEEHDEYMFQMLEERSKHDLVYILGDFVFDGENYTKYVERLSKLPCRIRLILGNHDSLKLMQESIFEHREPLSNYKGFWLSHCPIHPQEMRGRTGNIHGHLHSCSIGSSKYFNVNVEDNDFKLVPLDTIKDYFKESKWMTYLKRYSGINRMRKLTGL